MAGPFEGVVVGIGTGEARVGVLLVGVARTFFSGVREADGGKSYACGKGERSRGLRVKRKGVKPFLFGWVGEGG